MTQKLTILFDLDGTLVDTAPDLMDAHNHVMKKFGFQQSKLEDIKRLAGRGAWIMMQRSFREKITDEKMKKEIGVACPPDDGDGTSMYVKGRDLITGLSILFSAGVFHL